jgi:hypothetical protein
MVVFRQTAVSGNATRHPIKQKSSLNFQSFVTLDIFHCFISNSTRCGRTKKEIMSNFIKGITYSYNRNIGWQDRTIRTIVGIGATIGAIYFFKSNITYGILLSILAIAQFGTVLSARCIICYFTGQCTINSKEKRNLEAKGINYETQK